MSLGLDIRNEILAPALMVESMTSHMIGGLLGIKDVRNSKTLGNSGAALSFNQKIDLLIDLGALDGTVKKKFQTFMEVRNIFMHNLEADSFEKMATFLPQGKESFLLGQYPQPKEITQAEKLKNACKGLSTEVLSLTVGLLEKVKDKIKMDVEAESSKNMNKIYLESMGEAVEIFDKFIDKQLKKEPVPSLKQLKGVGPILYRLIYALIMKKMNINKKVA